MPKAATREFQPATRYTVNNRKTYLLILFGWDASRSLVPAREPHRQGL